MAKGSNALLRACDDGRSVLTLSPYFCCQKYFGWCNAARVWEDPSACFDLRHQFGLAIEHLLTQCLEVHFSSLFRFRKHVVFLFFFLHVMFDHLGEHVNLRIVIIIGRAESERLISAIFAWDLMVLAFTVGDMDID